MSTPNSRQAPKRKTPDEVKRIATELQNIPIVKFEDSPPLGLSEFLSSLGAEGRTKKRIDQFLRAFAHISETGTIGRYEGVFKDSLVTFKMVINAVETSIEDMREMEADRRASGVHAAREGIRDTNALKVVNEQVIPKIRQLAAALDIELTEPGQSRKRGG